MRLLVQLAAVVVVAVIGSTGVAAVEGKPWHTLGVGAATAVLAVLAYAAAVRLTERRPPSEVGPRRAAATLAGGTLIGVGLFGAVIAAMAVRGSYHVDGLGSATDAIGAFGFAAAAAVTEELMFRGVLFRHIEGWIGTWGALVLSALLFGLSHLTNPHASPWAALAIAVEAGGMLTAAYIATRRLWVPIGLHLGWNFAEGGIFGTQVSGRSDWGGLLDSTTSGSSLLTGGEFGPEAGLPALVGCLLVTVVFLVVAHRRGNLVPRRRRRAAHVDAVATLAP